MSSDRTEETTTFPLYADAYRSGADADPSGPGAPEQSRGPESYGQPDPYRAEEPGLARTTDSQPATPPPATTSKRRFGWSWVIIPVGFLVAGNIWGNGWDFSGNEVTAAASAPVSAIEVTGSTRDVTIRTDGEVTEPTVTAGRAEDDFVPAVTDGVLTIDTNEVGAVTVTLPEGAELQDIDITSSTGDIELENVTAPTITLETSTGRIQIDELGATSFDLTSSTGGIRGTLSDPIPESSRFETTTGDVELDFPDGDYQVDTQTSTGDVDVDLDQGAGPRVEVVTTTGDIDLE